MFRSLVRTGPFYFKPDSDTKKTPSRPASQNTGKWSRDESRRRIYARRIPYVYTL